MPDVFVSITIRRYVTHIFRFKNTRQLEATRHESCALCVVTVDNNPPKSIFLLVWCHKGHRTHNKMAHSGNQVQEAVYQVLVSMSQVGIDIRPEEGTPEAEMGSSAPALIPGDLVEAVAKLANYPEQATQLWQRLQGASLSAITRLAAMSVECFCFDKCGLVPQLLPCLCRALHSGLQHCNTARFYTHALCLPACPARPCQEYD